MAHQSKSPRLQALFEPTLQAYEKKTGISLVQHPLAIKLMSCDTVEAIDLLQDQARGFRDFHGRNKIMKSIRVTVSILSNISSIASLSDALGPVGEKGLMAY